VLEDTLKTLDGKLIAAEKQRIQNVVEALATGQEVEVTVATAAGAEVVLVLSSTDMIHDVKEQYAQHEGTMIHKQVLFHETDQPLADEVTIGSFGSPRIRLLLTVAVEQWVKLFQHDTERTTEWVNKETWLSISPDDPDAALYSCLDQVSGLQV
jgi:nitrate reductase NapAB chaperone NapD